MVGRIHEVSLYTLQYLEPIISKMYNLHMVGRFHAVSLYTVSLYLE